jgi:hypothetical protein
VLALGENPGQRDLGGSGTDLRRNGRDLVRDSQVLFECAIREPGIAAVKVGGVELVQ